ncbi:MAG: 4Fe-4S ferredoxin [Vallitaleaceae bacterium]|nr:4Fe-4S ferredoxin [Vallitaleaceae bacterium]
MKNKSIQSWSWIIIVSFFILGIVDFRFGLLGFVCMGAPIFHALRGEGKIHCSKYCPRGSFLGQIIRLISFNRPLPKAMRSKTVKNILFIIMISLLSFSLSHAGLNPVRIGFVLFRFMLISFLVGILMGIFFKPRSWCQVCPMGHASGLIAEQRKSLLHIASKETTLFGKVLLQKKKNDKKKEEEAA